MKNEMIQALDINLVKYVLIQKDLRNCIILQKVETDIMLKLVALL